MNELNAKHWRRGGVQAKNYVLHVAADEIRTLCGRERRLVNVSTEPAKDGEVDGALCRLCERKFRH